jgi:DNA-binding GntR family transcriptional regulator
MTIKQKRTDPSSIHDAPQLPLYQVVFQTLRDEIVSGRFDDFGQLPSELSLEERFGVCQAGASAAAGCQRRPAGA